MSKPPLIDQETRATVTFVKTLPLLFLVFVLMSVPALSEDWTTTDGKVYQNVKVLKVEDDAVTIVYKDGGALVPKIKLPPSLQKKYDYDPVKAKTAADARAAADAANAKKLQAEIDQADKLKKAKEIESAKQIQGNGTPGSN